MGFFRDFKNDLSATANESGAMDYEPIESEVAAEDIMVNTLDEEPQDIPDLSGLSASYSKELKSVSQVQSSGIGTVADGVTEDDGVMEDVEEIADETAIITAGLTVSGDLDSLGSIDVFGSVVGNVTCRGKITVSGAIYGNTKGNEIFANGAEIEGDIEAKGTVKIGEGTVIVGNVVATSAVIAGAVKGDIDVKGPVIVDSTAVIVGDIKSKTVQINNGANIDGRCSQCYADINTADIFDIKSKKQK